MFAGTEEMAQSLKHLPHSVRTRVQILRILCNDQWMWLYCQIGHGDMGSPKQAGE